MPRPSSDGLRQLAAELAYEEERIDRTVVEAADAARLVEQPSPERLRVYGSAALLDTFYSGVEKALTRIASPLGGGVPQGSGWHRRLLEDMTLAIPEVRPAVLGAQAARELERYLSFRHRFRNLYLFDLDLEPMRALLEALPAAWSLVRADLEGFRAFLLELARAT